MPELPEVEAYRLLAASRALHRPIASVDAPDSWILKRGLVPQAIATALGLPEQPDRQPQERPCCRASEKD